MGKTDIQMKFNNISSALGHGRIPNNKACDLVGDWIEKNLNIDKNLIHVSMNSGLKIRELDINKTLTATQKQKLLKKYPELKNKEIDG